MEPLSYWSHLGCFASNFRFLYETRLTPLQVFRPKATKPLDFRRTRIDRRNAQNSGQLASFLQTFFLQANGLAATKGSPNTASCQRDPEVLAQALNAETTELHLGEILPVAGGCVWGCASSLILSVAIGGS